MDYLLLNAFQPFISSVSSTLFFPVRIKVPHASFLYHIKFSTFFFVDSSIVPHIVTILLAVITFVHAADDGMRKKGN